MIDQRVHEFGRHERGVAGLRQRVAEQLQQLLARGGLGHQSRADPGPQGHEVFLPQQLQESPVSREDHRQQRRGIEVGTGEDPQLAEDLGLISWASSTRSTGRIREEATWVFQRSRSALNPPQRLCGASFTAKMSPSSR